MEIETIEKILIIEREMFLAVKSIEKAPCQSDIDSFLLHRKAQFIPWNCEVLRSYLRDLEVASQQGNNLMTLKYARIEGKIPILNSNPLIGKILEISREWQGEMIQQFPSIMHGARPLIDSDSSFIVSYLTYLRAELETYSDTTIRLLYNNLLEKRNQGINMSKEVYQYLVSRLGYKSLDSAEIRMKRNIKN